MSHTMLLDRLQQYHSFTDRELDVFYLYSKGFTSKYISTKLHISSRTVETHIRNIYSKIPIAKCKDDIIELYLTGSIAQ